MKPTPRRVVLLIGSLFAALNAVSLVAQEHHHAQPSSEELARLNAEWDRQYAEYQQRLARSAEVRPGMVVADLGAGRGGLTLELSKAVRPTGQVYANDIDPRMIAALQGLRREHGLDNVSVVEGEPEDPKLPPGRVQVAFLLKVYHQLEDAVGFLTTTREQLAPNGLLFIVDVDLHQEWGEAEGSVSDPEDCRRDALAAGFEVVRLERFPIVDYSLYQLVVRKPLD